MEHELPKILDGPDEPPTVEELEAVVRRAGQRRRASLVAGAVGLLLCGAVGGALVRGPVNDRTTGLAAGREDASAPAPPPAMGMAVRGTFGLPLSPQFRREANGVAIRVYRASWQRQGAPATPACAPPDTIHGELSNAAAIGFAVAPDLPGDGFALLSAGSFGKEEGEPATWAVVRAGNDVATVRIRLGDVTDSMAPERGIAVLVVPGNGADGVVEGLDGGGKVLITQPLSQLAEPPMDPDCMPGPCLTDPAAGPYGPLPVPAAPVPPDAGAAGSKADPSAAVRSKEEMEKKAAMAAQDEKKAACGIEVVPALPPQVTTMKPPIPTTTTSSAAP